jgi:hypothetical protein
MSEKSIFNARAVVYYYDTNKKNWQQTGVGNGYSRIDMYENSTNNSYRVIGRGLQDTSKVIINSVVTKDIQYSRASETFHQWSDSRLIYGLNFSSKEEAENFGKNFEEIVNKLKSGDKIPPPVTISNPTLTRSKSPRQNESNISSSESVSSSESISTPTPPPAPAPPAPKTSEIKVGGGDATQNRSALLNSICSFKKDGLKKVQTVDKSSPLIEEEKKKPNSIGNSNINSSSANSSVGSSNIGGGDMMSEIMKKRGEMLKSSKTPKEQSPKIPEPTPNKVNPSIKSSQHTTPIKLNSQKDSNTSSISNSDIKNLKEEILTEMRKELEKMKLEILAAIQKQ